MGEFDDKTGLFVPTAATGENKISACFMVIAGAHSGQLYKVDATELIVGRGADCAIRIEDEGVSRRHARIERGPEGSLVVEDLNSTNGTLVNGQKITRHVLQDGDKLQVGRTSILKFSYADALEEDFQRRQYEWATRDALTGVSNKKFLQERLNSEFFFALRQKKPLTLAMFDIDHFKKVNDTHGHPAGDAILRAVSQVLVGLTRRTDVLARFGGEEFCAVMRETVLVDGRLVCERIRAAVEATQTNVEGVVIPVTISIGLAALSDTGEGFASPEALLKSADEMLYRAKHNGRNRVES